MKTEYEVLKSFEPVRFDMDCGSLVYDEYTIRQAMILYAAKFQQEWVDVKDRLPDETDEYLVIVTDGIDTWRDIKEYDDDLQWRTQLTVLYWQPLPSTPKEK